MEVDLPKSATRVIEISAQKIYSSFSIFLVILVVLLTTGAISFCLGFLVGKYQAINADTQPSTGNQKSSLTEKGKNIYFDKNEGYKVSYPEGWKATKKEAGIPGVILKSETASIEIWLSVEQPVTLNAEQKEGIEKTDSVDILVASQKLKMTQFIYKAGNYFSILVLPAKDNYPKVTFWTKALDKADYEQALKIVQSFSF